MVVRRPLVRIGGKTRQLPAGEFVPAGPTKLIVYLADGSASSIAVTVDFTIPAYLADGSRSDIPLQA